MISQSCVIGQSFFFQNSHFQLNCSKELNLFFEFSLVVTASFSVLVCPVFLANIASSVPTAIPRKVSTFAGTAALAGKSEMAIDFRRLVQCSMLTSATNFVIERMSTLDGMF